MTTGRELYMQAASPEALVKAIDAALAAARRAALEEAARLAQRHLDGVDQGECEWGCGRDIAAAIRALAGEE